MIRSPSGSFVYQSLQPRHQPVATWILTVAIAMVSVIGETVPGVRERFAILPWAVRGGEWWLIITGSFLHGSWLHLAANAYFGWSIGSRIERYIGWWRMLVITAVAMAGSGLAVSYLSNVPAVGFSGVLYGWLASWLAFHLTPRFPGLRLSGPQRSAFLQLLGANLLISLLPGISLLAHLGGFVSGFAAAYTLGQGPGGLVSCIRSSLHLH